MTPTTFPLLDDEFPLEPEAAECFQVDGHVLVEGLAARDEIAAFEPLIERVALDTAWDKRPLAVDDIRERQPPDG
jgi:hypothetical protein